jgi:hypothetical protein
MEAAKSIPANGTPDLPILIPRELRGKEKLDLLTIDLFLSTLVDDKVMVYAQTFDHEEDVGKGITVGEIKNYFENHPAGTLLNFLDWHSRKDNAVPNHIAGNYYLHHKSLQYVDKMKQITHNRRANSPRLFRGKMLQLHVRHINLILHSIIFLFACWF